MLIIAKKKDYYDGVVGTMGVDKTLVYNRDTIEIENDDMPKIFKGKRGYWGITYRENPFHELAYHNLKKEYKTVCDEHAHFIVGFCGKLYIGWKLYHGSPIYPHEVTTTITYDNERIIEILEKRSWHGNLEDSIKYVQTFDAIQIFRDLNAPAFVYDGDYNRLWLDSKRHNYHNPKFFINPLLKDYEFYKIFGAFEAFQEVSMFIGGVLGKGEKEIVEVADKYKITQHGFDKWSFRKEPQNKK